jgi:LmbE family N-acetylglucosaminyl deacetylase
MEAVFDLGQRNHAASPKRILVYRRVLRFAYKHASSRISQNFWVYSGLPRGIFVLGFNTRCGECEFRMRRQILRADEELFRRPVAIVAAHPDDELIGLGSLLPHFQEIRAIVHTTDGAPRDGPDIRNAGAATWLDYAQLRRNEFRASLQASEISPDRAICLWIPDQQAAFRIHQLTLRLASIFTRLHPRFVFTHTYEGGHPDHDSTAAAVHYAVACLRRAGLPNPRLFEFASYHASENGMETETFLSNLQAPFELRVLNDAERLAKRKLLAAYVTQKSVLSQFPLCYEPVRAAPEYDFTKPPHPGTLFYELFDWGINGREWRRLAWLAQRRLGFG